MKKDKVPKPEDKDDYWLSPDLLRVKSWIQLWDNVQLPDSPLYHEKLTERILSELESIQTEDYEEVPLRALNPSGSSR